MAEKEYIDRAPFIANLTAMKKAYDAINIEAMIKALANARAADVAPVVHAEWMPSPDGINPIKCRRCGTVAPYRMESDFNNDIGLYPYKSNYCPNCGARMDGGKHG